MPNRNQTLAAELQQLETQSAEALKDAVAKSMPFKARSLQRVLLQLRVTRGALALELIQYPVAQAYAAGTANYLERLNRA